MIPTNKTIPVPTSYICRCGSRVMSATGDKVLMRRDKATQKLIEQKCPCGGAFKLEGPLQIVQFVDLATLRVACKPCRAIFKKVTPARFSCPSCNETALVNERTLWLFASAKVTVDYAPRP